MDGPTRDADRIEPGTAVALIAMGLGVIVIANDFTALNVALPAIEEDFNVDVGTSQWVINAYCLVFGMAIVTGGRLADLFGRRRAFFVGSVLFAGFSLLGGVAQDTPWLIAARVGMGIGGALMWPAILGHDLRGAAGVEGGARRRADPGRRGHRQRDGATAWRGPDRRAELALDLLPERPDRGLRRLRHLAQGPSAATGRSRTSGSTIRAWSRWRSGCCWSCSPSTRPPIGVSATPE